MIQDLRIAHALLVHSKFRKTFKKEMKNYACNIRARANSKKVALFISKWCVGNFVGDISSTL